MLYATRKAVLLWANGLSSGKSAPNEVRRYGRSVDAGPQRRNFVYSIDNLTATVLKTTSYKSRCVGFSGLQILGIRTSKATPFTVLPLPLLHISKSKYLHIHQLAVLFQQWPLQKPISCWRTGLRQPCSPHLTAVAATTFATAMTVHWA